MTRNIPWIVVIGVLGAWMATSRAERPPLSLPPATVSDPILRSSVARLESELATVKGMVPEQSVAMLTVAQQFTNLWYAAKQNNWPLAAFFLEETSEGIEWAVKLKPIHQIEGGNRVDIAAIFQALENSVFPEVQAAIAAADHDRFRTAYRHTIEGCYACHKAVGKPFLRPTIPSEPATAVINFDPQARWPQ